MSLSRQNYEAVAAVLVTEIAGAARTRKATDGIESRSYDRGYDNALQDVVAGLADYFASDNPRFDRDRFLAVCFGLAQ